MTLTIETSQSSKTGPAQLDLLAARRDRVRYLDVPPIWFVMVDGSGRPRGRHHEIYLGDPRRARPERLRTILRQPLERAA